MTRTDALTPRPKPGRLLVVDDEAKLMTALCDTLAEQGYETAGFTTAAEALDALSRQEFAVLITDMQMPQIDGMALLHKAQALDPHLVAIMMTGHGTVETAVEAMKLGAFDYVQKPLKLRDLLPVLTRALEVRRLRQENLQLRELVGIHELSAATSFTLDADTILNKVMDVALEQFGADEVSILLPTPDEKGLYVSAARGTRREQILNQKIALDDGIAGWVVRHREALILNGPVNDPRFAPLHPRPDIHTAISLPMMVGGQCVGVLNVNATKPRRPFTLGQVKALSILTSTAAPALKAATLYAELRSSNERLRILHQIDRALIAAEGPEAIAAGALPPLRELLGVPRAVVNLFDLVNGEVEMLAAAGRRRVHAGSGVRYSIRLMGDVEALRRGEPQLIDVHALPPSPEVGALLASGVYTYAVVPMIAEGELIGALSFGGPSGPFSTEQISIAQGAATQFALVLMQARLHDRIKRQAQEMRSALSDRKQSEESLRQSELQFRQVWDKSVDGMRLTDPHGNTRMVNDAFCRMVDMPREALEGKPYTTIYAGLQDESLASHRERFASRSIEPYFTKEIVLWNGKKAHFELSNSFLELPGQAPQLLSVIRDVTEHKNLEMQLRQAQKMEAFGQLAGGVAHDFNNLVTIITGYSEMLLSGAIPADKHRDFIREIRKAGERAASLTRQLLAFSRKQMLHPVELDLNALVSDTEKMLRRLIGEDIDLATVLDPALGRVKADSGQIEQVIMNLAVNARDAMPTGGHLTIETQNIELDQDYVQKHPAVQPGRYVMLAVTDSGCGMDEATRARIFEPFFTTKEVGKGTGLGLATVHGIVKQSGGSIEVYSEVEHGTTFKVYLPRVKAAVSSAESLPGPSLAPRGTETILLAEDEDGVRAIGRLALESDGYTVLAARNGEEAAQLCQQHPGPIHLLMTDVIMPKMSGRQLADRVVRMRPNIQVLYLSGYTDDSVVRHGVLEAEMSFLQKPYTPTVLRRKVREVLDAGKTKLQQVGDNVR